MAPKNVSVKKDLANKKITVVRSFDAPVERVWKAWTQRELLDQWWAPKPWKAETQSMDFRLGGKWLYDMVGPDGERHHAAIRFDTIEENKSFTAEDFFTDADGNKLNDMPSMNWYTTFDSAGNQTTVTINISFSSEEDLNKILEMGFEQGFTSALGNLDDLLKS